MSEPSPITTRAAEPRDFDFCQRLYFENMREIIEALHLDTAQPHEGFARQWQMAEVRIIAAAGEDVGWMQTAPADDAVFLKQLYLDGRFQRRGIGSRVLWALIEETSHAHKAVTLGVVKINPARRLYERLGFRITHEDQHKFYMRREPDWMPI
jgi:ribosomal protein S18 acetylase RimI-like enzyme